MANPERLLNDIYFRIHRKSVETKDEMKMFLSRSESSGEHGSYCRKNMREWASACTNADF